MSHVYSGVGTCGCPDHGSKVWPAKRLARCSGQLHDPQPSRLQGRRSLAHQIEPDVEKLTSVTRGKIELLRGVWKGALQPPQGSRTAGAPQRAPRSTALLDRGWGSAHKNAPQTF